MPLIGSAACNAIPVIALGDPTKVKEGSERIVLMPNGQKTKAICLNGQWAFYTQGPEYTLATLPPAAGLPTGTPYTVTDYGGNVAVAVNGQWRFELPFRTTWADRPAVELVPAGTELQVTDYGNQKWINDGTYWRPAQGRVLIYAKVTDSLATPLATLSAAGIFAIPGGAPKIPAGMIIPQMKVCATTQFRKYGTAASASVNTKLGTTGGFGDQYLCGGSIGNNNLGDMKANGFAFFGAQSNRYISGGWMAENSSSYGGVVTEISTNVNTAADMWATPAVTVMTAPDTIGLLSHQVWLEA